MRCPVCGRRRRRTSAAGTQAATALLSSAAGWVLVPVVLRVTLPPGVPYAWAWTVGLLLLFVVGVPAGVVRILRARSGRYCVPRADTAAKPLERDLRLPLLARSPSTPVRSDGLS